MKIFSFLLKTYIGDLQYVIKLIDSFNKYNSDNILIYVVVPSKDLFSFNCISSELVKIISEESLGISLTKEKINGIRPGYINQAIIKLGFWEAGYSKNYFCVDSDSIFIKNFFISDFIHSKDVPYSVLVEDKELMVDPGYFFKQNWNGRFKSIRKIQKSLGMNSDRKVLTSHGFSIFSSKVLKSLKNDFLEKNKIDYIDLMKISPYEPSWYNMWLQHKKPIEIHPIEPLFKTFHYKNHHLDYLIKKINLNDISRGYLGLVINSNYSRGWGIVSYNDSTFKHLGNYFKLKDLFLAIVYKIFFKLKSFILN